ncbi:MAG: DMT family transporter [Alphaproteobacteria bacterium]
MTGLSAPMRGILWMLLQAASMAVTMAAVRKLSIQMPIVEIIFFRALIGFAIQAPWLMQTGPSVFRPAALGLVTLRSTFVFAAMVLWFAALAAMPISDAVALQFTLPLFAIMGAGLILGEEVGARRLAAAAAGFAGALVIIRPGFVEINPMALVVLVSAAFVAAVQITTKRLAGRVPGAVLVFHMNLLMLPIAAIAVAPVWMTPQMADIPWLLAVGVFGNIAHIFMMRAMQAADASLVAPVDFMRLPMAAGLGWLLFRETSDIWTWAGAAIIFANATYIARRETESVPSKPERP